MSEIRRVHYKLRGSDAPIIHLECRTIEQAEEERRLSRASSVTSEEWKAKAFTDLREWIGRSVDISKTVRIWAAVYIRCGACAGGFWLWYEQFDPGPEDDLEAWLQAAESIITEKRWI